MPTETPDIKPGTAYTTSQHDAYCRSMLGELLERLHTDPAVAFIGEETRRTMAEGLAGLKKVYGEAYAMPAPDNGPVPYPPDMLQTGDGEPLVYLRAHCSPLADDNPAYFGDWKRPRYVMQFNLQGGGLAVVEFGAATRADIIEDLLTQALDANPEGQEDARAIVALTRELVRAQAERDEARDTLAFLLSEYQKEIPWQEETDIAVFNAREALGLPHAVLKVDSGGLYYLAIYHKGSGVLSCILPDGLLDFGNRPYLNYEALTNRIHAESGRFMALTDAPQPVYKTCLELIRSHQEAKADKDAPPPLGKKYLDALALIQALQGAVRQILVDFRALDKGGVTASLRSVAAAERLLQVEPGEPQPKPEPEPWLERCPDGSFFLVVPSGENWILSHIESDGRTEFENKPMREAVADVFIAERTKERSQYAPNDCPYLVGEAAKRIIKTAR